MRGSHREKEVGQVDRLAWYGQDDSLASYGELVDSLGGGLCHPLLLGVTREPLGEEEEGDDSLPNTG